MEPESALRARGRRVFAALKRMYPDAHCELSFKDPFQLAVATVLSAQCTDAAVNRVTPALFAAYPNAAALAKASVGEIEPFIRSLGLFRNKARSLAGLGRALAGEHGGAVPRTMEALTALPGVGRKTANVILSNAFGLPGLAVDTHVLRVGRRLGLINTGDPGKAEGQLGVLFPPKDWGMLSHTLIWHGRRVCRARGPLCAECGLARHCPSAGRSAAH